MNWSTLSSMLCCIADFVTATIFLGICSYNMTVCSQRERRLPVPLMESWCAHLTKLIPIMAYIIVGSVLMLHIVGVIACIVCCQLVNKLSRTPPTSSIQMKNITLEIFANHQKTHASDSFWIPTWLVDVQEENDQCCGVIGIQDWKDFWPHFPNRIPTSCCKRDQKCDLNQLDWTDRETSSELIKSDKGCWSQINKKMMEEIRDTVSFLAIMISLLSLSIVVIAFQYIKEFCIAADINKNNDLESENGGRGPGRLTVGEIWARMGFGKKTVPKHTCEPDKCKRAKVVQSEDTVDDSSISYTDIFLKQFQVNIVDPRDHAMTNINSQNEYPVYRPTTTTKDSDQNGMNYIKLKQAPVVRN